jgi:ring-1,2-phenylacetyl-CoA epoxidase subunit PaaE
MIMSIHFHPLRVKQVRRETAEAISVLFEVPESLADTFRFTQGQNITVKADVNGASIRRSYSICSAPGSGELRIAIKQVTGGAFSTWANERLQAGAILDVLPPTGRFYTHLAPQQQKHYLAFAAGSGITPILSILQATLETEPESRFTLVYGNKSSATILFKETLEALKNKYMNRLVIHHVLSREFTDIPIQDGRIDQQKCLALGEKLIDYRSVDEVFLCGPESMIFAVKDSLMQQGITEKNIHFELFSSPGQTTSLAKPVSEKQTASDQVSQVTIQLDGRTFTFPLGYDGASILDSALQQGADLPFACKGGVCCTCRAKVLEGAVSMDVNYALEPDEVAAGFILTCQSHPRSLNLVVSFDDK